MKIPGIEKESKGMLFEVVSVDSYSLLFNMQCVVSSSMDGMPSIVKEVAKVFNLVSWCHKSSIQYIYQRN